ncbi:MAG: SLC13/DASS family transporter [Clostridiales bacterium]|nr:SLC13/DASS family transporter [Clostridiales bacterium]
MGIPAGWEQTAAWLVLTAVLLSIISGKVRYEIPAFGGLLLLGFLGLQGPSELFVGFASPALFTVATVLVMSAGIVESGILSGLGKKIAGRIHKPKNQILAVFLTTGLISAFMNNVGAVGVTLPTARRMAKRANVPASAFGMPIAFASILGGSLTLIGTASNLIVSAYRQSAFGAPFRMFDFTLQGLAILGTGILVIFLCRVCGLGPIGQKSPEYSGQTQEEYGQVTEMPAGRTLIKSLLVLLPLLAAILLTGAGVLHPSVGFGIVIMLWLGARVLSYKNALESINLPVVLFLGSMFGISGILQETGALGAAIGVISPIFEGLPPFWLILIFLFITALLSNIIDNSVSAVLMAPVAIELSRAGGLAVNPDALLMAVAAGASLGVIMPTHQATLVVSSSMEFSKKSFMKTGAAVVLLAGILSTLVIYAVWR